MYNVNGIHFHLKKQGNRLKTAITMLSIFLLFPGCSPPVKEIPTGVVFHKNTLARKGNFGDNWCQTWAADNNIYTMMDDGNGWWGDTIGAVAFPNQSGSMCLQIQGDANFTSTDVKRMTGWPENGIFSPFYAYGTVSVDGIIYVWLWKSAWDQSYTRPIANRLLYSPDFGQTFYRWNGEKETEETFSETDSSSFFFYKEDPKWKIDRDAYAFNWIAFCQNGKDNSSAKDDYVYMYAPEQYEPSKLAMIRVEKSNILDKSAYEYFKSWNGDKPEWTRNMKERGVNLQYPERRTDGKWMWASWFPDVVYNEGLDQYIMVSYGVTDEGKEFWDGWCKKCTYPGSLGFWYAENPWGPWEQFYYTEYFFADAEDNRTYGFKLNPKWISEDGKNMQLIWSDAGYDHWKYYRWNQMEIEILTN
ncbi:MAG: DUF4185 domain-containing protein [Cytophagales bacterium]|nr:DUF4185 domain-containing protein [Cytophagales bacterium]